MKLALCQLNFTIGDIEGNAAKIRKTIVDLEASGTELAVFSELSICGYPPLDLLERDDFVEKCLIAISDLASHCNHITAIVGGPSFNRACNGKRLHNTAFVLGNGTIQHMIHKTLLPDYDVFDEYRFFEPAREWKTISAGKEQIAITVCEDIWEEQPWSAGKKLYHQLPLEQISNQKPSLIINISASPFSYNQHQYRQNILASVATKYHCPVVYVNQTGANTDLVFDGGSMVMSEDGKTNWQGPFFAETIHRYDTGTTLVAPPFSLPDSVSLIHDAVVTGIRDYFSKSGFRKAVLGLSGGIDSALVAVLACKALGSENVTGLLMPSSFSSQHSVDDAVQLARNLGMEHHILPISGIYDAFGTTLAPAFKDTPFGIAEENIQARVRGSLLMAWSNKFGNILLNTSNKSEMAVGYGTLYGDMCGAIAVLGDVYKTQVYQLARYINRNGEVIPVNTITKPPSAELRHDQKDSDSLPEYDLLDAILFRYIETNMDSETIIAEGYDKQIVEKTLRMVNANEYKRYQAPPAIRISTKAFGPGRRMPLVGKL